MSEKPAGKSSSGESPARSASGESPSGHTGRDSTRRSLAERFPGLVCDLDGVVYRGAQALPHAIESLADARRSGARIVYATNNASRPPAVVAEALRKLGIALDDADVLTSSVAGARQLAEQLPTGAKVLAIGGPGVAEALHAVDLRPVDPADAERVSVDAVLQGYGKDVTAAALGEAAYAIQGGARWVATNDDLTLPTERGVAPGNGSLVRAVRLAVDTDPTVVGKPGALLYELAAQALGTEADHTLGIGDRLETDVEGAHAAGMSALHVLTGVHGPADLVRAHADSRPRFVAEDLRALNRSYEEPQRALDGRWTMETAAASGSGAGSSFRIDYTDRSDSGGPEWIDRLRLALRVLWEAIDAQVLTSDEAVAALPSR